MPIYEYVCKCCGHELETLQFLNEDPLTDCPECGQSGLKRKISAAGFRLSGGGWYETDFKPKDRQRHLAGERESGDRKSEKNEAAGKGESTPSSSDKPAGTKPEKKPAGEKKSASNS